MTIATADYDTVRTGIAELTEHNRELLDLLDAAKEERDAADQDLRIATALIAQLPSEHEGRNSWMLRYGEEKT